MITRWFLRFALVELLMFAAAMLVSVGWAQTMKPPDRELLFVPNCCQDRLYRLSLDHGVMANLTANRSGFNREPVWSADGSQIAFAVFCDGSWALMIMDELGRNIRQVGECLPYFLSQLRWSPDKTRIAAVGSEFTYATFHRAIIFDLRTEQPAFSLLQSRNLSANGWSADGSEALFTNLSAGSTRWHINAENGLIHSHPFDTVHDEPNWSPDHQYTAVSVPVPNPYRMIVQIRDAAVDEVIAAVEPTARNYLPVWSPDGGRIAFLSVPDNRPDWIGVYVVDADGGNLRYLAEIPLNPHEPGFFAPQWTPDSQLIIFGSATQFAVVDARTGHVLTQQPYSHHVTIRP